MEKTKSLLMLGNCLDRLKDLEDNSVDAICTDPPYGFGGGKTTGFMGKEWDRDVPSVAIWQECLRVLKPGGSLLAFAGTRTQHRMAINIEDAGFVLKDIVSWVYGSGFPKSLNVAKALRKMGNVPEETIQKWEGFGTALKPSHEPITWAIKPSPTPSEMETDDAPVFKYCAKAAKKDRNSGLSNYVVFRFPVANLPANLSELNNLTEDDDVRWVIDDKKENVMVICPKDNLNSLLSNLDDGTKPDGIDDLTKWEPLTNQHATVKPNELMRWLCKLATPEGGTILDPFMGSGSTGVAALQEGFGFVGIEMEPSYLEIAKLRIANT